MTDQPDFDGCNSECRRKGAHTLRWGRCEHATPPEPTVSMSVVYTDHDGYPSIGFDSYTVQQLADLIEPALRTAVVRVGHETEDRAHAIAHAIVHRNDKPEPTKPAACGAYQPPADPADSGLCARCGMYDYRHATQATEATDGWTRQDDGTWTMTVEGAIITAAPHWTAEHRAKFAAEWKRQHKPAPTSWGGETCACCGGGPMIPQSGNRTTDGRALCIPCANGSCACGRAAATRAAGGQAAADRPCEDCLAGEHTVNAHRNRDILDRNRAIEQRDQQRERAEVSERQRDRLADVLREVLAEFPRCALDRDGDCHTLGCPESGRRCSHDRARKALAEIDRKEQPDA